MKHNNFWSRYRAAFDAGLNADWCLKVAYGCVELDAALGDMDYQSESKAIAGTALNFPEHDCGCRGSAYCNECIPF